MNHQENKERTNDAIEVEDLTVEETAQQNVKGGINNLKQIGLALHNANDTRK